MTSCAAEGGGGVVAQVDVSDVRTEKEHRDEVRFSPPVFKQRYHAALEVAKRHSVKSVVDFGCAECKMLIMYKSMLQLEHLVGVDVDRCVLDLNGHRAKPMMHEFIVKPRSVELRARVLEGSICQKDERLRHFDMVSAIELIEHLESETLDEVPRTVFGFIQPTVALFTTPNADFNKYFDFLPGQFRHFDHKFEWSRDEFRQWCEQCCQQYPSYKVHISQIGFLEQQSKEDREVITGGCSQMAVFERDTETYPRTCLVEGNAEIYKTVVDVKYPFDERSRATRIVDEMLYALARLTKESEMVAEIQGVPQQTIVPLHTFLDFPILAEQADGDTQLIEDIFNLRAHEDFPGFELIQLEDGSRALCKWVYPYESSSCSETEWGDASADLGGGAYQQNHFYQQWQMQPEVTTTDDVAIQIDHSTENSWTTANFNN